MKLLSVASARPNFVKLAAVDHAVRSHGGIDHVIVHTGQHYDPLLSDIFFTQLSIFQPAHNLGIHGGDRQEVVERTKEALIPVLKQEKPDCVLVYGDVNGALGAAQAAYELGIKLAHVEAGLRSGDLEMPEENNRIAIDQLANFLFCTEQSGVDHLAQGGIKGAVHLVGNTMIDTLIRMMPAIKQAELPAILPKNFGIVTLHRPSNVDDAGMLRMNIEFLNEVAEELPLVLPVHHRLAHNLDAFDLRRLVSTNITLLEPQAYLSFLHMVEKSACILTDSGGIQEEAVLFKKRCFTLRRNTERPSTIESGSNVLIDPESPTDRALVLTFAANPQSLTAVTIPQFWDGKAGERILEVLKHNL
jgi:UDP-N-acetylglucosamine 2-epimerase (non-hydrolysing)